MSAREVVVDGRSPVDLFSVSAVEQALHAADIVVFALHDPPQTAQLTQGDRLDLLDLCADTVARAAARAGVRTILDASGRPGVAEILAGQGVAVQSYALEIRSAPKPKLASHHVGIVRSIQRLPVPPGRDAAWLMDAYAHWLLPWVPKWLVRARRVGDIVRFSMLFGLLTILQLERDVSRCQTDREVWQVTGGLLASVRPERLARLEFRVLPGGTEALVALHEFRPWLPWWFYRATQAIVHAWTMAYFGRYLRRLR